MSATQQIITLDDISADNAPAIYVQDGLKPFFEKVKASVSSEVPDITTRKGRERIASLAAAVSKSKTAVEKPGRDYLKRLKEMPKVVEAELREFVNSMDALRDATRQPLTDWETAEVARKDRHVDAVQAIKDKAVELGEFTAAELSASIATAEAIPLGVHWEEFEAEAARAKDDTLAKLRAALTSRERYDAEQAELSRLRAEAEDRAKADREAAIAREAVERERQAAEQRAQAERDAAAQREQALAAAAREAEAAIERQALELQLQREQAARAAEQAERNRIAAEQQAEQDRLAAIKRQADAVEAAKQAEIRRQAAEKEEEQRLAAAREADKAHKARINRAALDAFVAGGMTEECAKQAITLIAKRQIPSITITY